MLIVPGLAPPRLTHTRRSARPIVAFARQPGPSAPAAELMSSAARAGPLTTKTGATASVVPETPTRLKASSQSASTPASRPRSGRGEIRGAVRTTLRGGRNRRGAPDALLRRRSRPGGRLGEQMVHLTHQQEDRERHNDEIDQRIEEQAVVERRGARGLRGGEGRKRLAREAQEEILEVRAPEQP